MSILEEKVQKMLVTELNSITTREKELNELFGIPASNFSEDWKSLTNSEPPTTPLTIPDLPGVVGSPTNDPSPDVKDFESLKIRDLYRLLLKHPANLPGKLGPDGMNSVIEYITTRWVQGGKDIKDYNASDVAEAGLIITDPKIIIKIGNFIEQVVKNPPAMLDLINKSLGKETEDPETPGETEDPETPGDKPEDKDTGISLKKLDVGKARAAINQLRNMGVSADKISKMIDDGVGKIEKNARMLGAGAIGRKFRENDLPVIEKIKDEISKILNGEFDNLVKESKQDIYVHPLTYSIMQSIISEISVQRGSDMEMYSLQNKSDQDLETLMPVLKKFLPWAKEQLGFDKPVSIHFVSDSENAKDPMGTTGHYQPNTDTVTVYVDGRHPKDILRSLSHELVHHNQNCNGKLAQIQYTGEGYAQKDKVGKECEDEAYLVGNGRLVRTFGDTIWKNVSDMRENNMKKLNEIHSARTRPDSDIAQEVNRLRAATKNISTQKIARQLIKWLDAGARARQKPPASYTGIGFVPGDTTRTAGAAAMLLGKERIREVFQHMEPADIEELLSAAERMGDIEAEEIVEILNELIEKTGTRSHTAMNMHKESKTMDKVEEKKKFPDLTGDGKVTQADILKGRGVNDDDEEPDEEEVNEDLDEDLEEDIEEGYKDPLKKEASFKKFVNGGKNKALFEKLTKEWCK
jgi:hypothetical protein